MDRKSAVWAALAVLAAMSAASGCSAAKPKSKTELIENVNAYHQHMRWGRYSQAAGFMAEGDQEAFLGRHEALGDDFRVVEIEIKNVRLVRPDEEAEAEVVMAWIREPDMRVHRDKIVEKWRNVDGRWVLVERELQVKKP